MKYDEAPAYLQAADLHNVGAENTSFFDSPVEQTTDFISKIPSFAVTSVASGINSIYNSAVVAGNWLGVTNAEENDLQSILGAYDSNLGEYYSAHKSAVDLAGFVGTSLAPGIGGIKLFNTGQRVLSGALKTGSVGRSLTEGIGLIPTLTVEGKTLTQVAGESLAAGQQTFSLMNAGVLKAIGSGFAQATWESAVFESFVAASMFKSPVLEGQDFKDIASNILTGAALGGGIGGFLNVAKVYGGIKETITAADLANKPFTLRSSQFGLTDASDKILVAAGDLKATPLAVNPAQEALRTQRIVSINQEIRTNVNTLTKGDSELGNILADSMQGMEPEQLVRMMQGAKQVTRPGYQLTPAEGNVVGYARLHGESVGEVTFDTLSKRSLTLADKLLNKEQILKFVASAKFSTKKLWNPVTAGNIDEVEARYIWAEKTAKYEDGMVVHSGDIPLQEGALRAGVSIEIDDGIHTYTVAKDQLANEVLQNKRALAQGFLQSKNSGWGLAVGADAKDAVSTITSGEIARIANVSPKFLESQENASAFARQDSQSAYDAMRASKKLTKGDSDLSFIPQHAAVVYDVNGLSGGRPLQQGYKRLYRAEYSGPKKDLPDWIKLGQEESGHTAATGRWFVQDKSMLDFYLEDIGPQAKIKFVDVPEAQLESYRVSNVKEKIAGRTPGQFSADPKNEFFLSKELAESATEHSEATSDTVSAMQKIAYQQKIVQEGVDRAFAGTAGNLTERFTHPTQAAIINSNRYGAGAGLVSFANGSYGSLASWAEVTGKATADLAAKLGKNTAAILDSVSLRLRTSQEAAIEFDRINQLVASSTERYVLNEAEDGLIAVKLLEYRNAVKSGELGTKVPTLQAGSPEEILFKNLDAGEAVVARIASNGNRVTHSSNLRAAQGLADSRDANTFYPLKPQPRDYPHFAFVKNETVTGAGLGHTSMLHAASESQLEEMIKMVRSKSGYTVYTKSDAETFYRSRSEYEWDRTLHDNYMDASLKSMGVNNQFFPKTNPEKIVDGWLDIERRADDALAREAVSAKYGNEFDQLETLGSQYTNIASSRYGVSAKSIEGTVQNPYNDYRKTALNISRLSEYPLLTAFNRGLEKAVSSVFQRVVDVWDEAKSINDLEKVNSALSAAGISHAYKSSAEIILANHTAPKAYVSQFIRGANAILANTFLRLDPLNALNNALGSQVLLGHETTQLLKGIRNADPKLAGELAEIGRVGIPGTGGDSIASAGKFIANAFKEFYEADPELKKFYKDNGWTTRISDQYRSMLDDLSVGGHENVAQLNTRLAKAFEKAKEFGARAVDSGEKFTGNKFAEEMNRFISASVARQISDIGVRADVLTPESQLSYINTFVNRTQGNVLASQRPLIFQGPIGQAVGLFQTFQFNTIQQLFRSVSEGSAKDMATLLGLQGTIYGLNGLPGFQYINQHIVGTASGNKNHTDAYSSLYGSAGKEAGDWLMYGIPSNLLQTNIYSRGDINPRTLTIIPTAPQDVVAVSAFAKFAGNLKETVSKIVGGGDVWQSILQGLEHNTISRPLAGLAQTLQAVASPSHQVFSTTNAGDISFVNDLLSLSTLSRIAGGKPLDEALANDEVSRSMVYKAADRERMKAATERFKTTVIGSKSATLNEGDVHNYLEAYVRNGGRAEDFNKSMLSALTRANAPRANQVIATLKGPYAAHMKSLMGGSVEELQD